MEYGLERFFGERQRQEVERRIISANSGINEVREELEQGFTSFHGPLPDLKSLRDFQEKKYLLTSTSVREKPYAEVLWGNAYLYLLGARADFLLNKRDSMGYVVTLQGTEDIRNQSMADMIWPLCVTLLFGSDSIRDLRRRVYPRTMGLTLSEMNMVILKINGDLVCLT